MTAIAFALAIVYLAYFYFFIDYGVEKEMLFIPLFFRGAASVIISIVYLTSIVQSGLPFQIFPQCRSAIRNDTAAGDGRIHERDLRMATDSGSRCSGSDSGQLFFAETLGYFP